MMLALLVSSSLDALNQAPEAAPGTGKSTSEMWESRSVAVNEHQVNGFRAFSKLETSFPILLH